MTTPNIVWYVDPTGACKVFMHADNVVRSFDAPNPAAAQRTIASVAIDAFAMPQVDAEALAQQAVQDQTAAAALPKTLSDHILLLQEQMMDHDRELTEATRGRLKAESDLRMAQGDIQRLTTQLADATKPAAAPVPIPVDVARLMPVGEAQPHDPNGPNVPGTSASSVLSATPQNPQGVSGAESEQYPISANAGATGTAERAAVGTQPGGQISPAQQTHNPPATGDVVSTAEGETSPPATYAPHNPTGAAPNQATAGGELGTP